MTYAFHAREVRIERDSGSGFESLFPETFSFHADRHDPAELYLRIEDLWSNPQRLGPGAGRRDAEELVMRLLTALPGMLADVFRRLQEARDESSLIRASEDAAVFAQVALRFVGDKGLADQPRLRLSIPHLRKMLWRALATLVFARVRPEALEAYATGRAKPASSEDPYELSFFWALAEGDAGQIDERLLAAAERAHRAWLEDVCLDEQSRVFEGEDSPFERREEEVLDAICEPGCRHIERGRDLSIFLRRPGSRDCQRLLSKLETYFLRQYDVHHAAALRHHAALLQREANDSDRRLSRHGTRTYLLALAIPALPFLAAIFFYRRDPRLFDWWASLEVMGVLAGAFWFLAYRFMWRKDLTFFHASVPRIGAGIIVGYLPVFIIDEVWDLAQQAPLYVLSVCVLLGSATLLYIYVEVQRKLEDPPLAFARARSIFLLGLVEAAAFGLLVTSLLGPLMAGRDWGPEGSHHSLEALRSIVPPFVGELPRILGVSPFPAFPTAVLLMSFLAFFIGTFLQLLWEDIPITEPL